MNINGKNGRTCVTNLQPLSDLPVIRDLFIDRTGFF